MLKFKLVLIFINFNFSFQFELCGLKAICEKAMATQITKDNALELAKFARENQASTLEKEIVKFLK